MHPPTHIRTKLGLALAVLLAALVAVSGYEVVSARSDVARTRSQIELATVSVGPGSLITRLQDERDRTTFDLIGVGATANLAVSSTSEARSLVDRAVADLRSTVERRGTHAFDAALASLDALSAIRADVDASRGPRDLSSAAVDVADRVFTRYTELLDPFFAASSTVAVAVDDVGLRNGVEIVDAAARRSEASDQILRRVVLSIADGTSTTAGPRQEVAVLRERAAALDARIATSAIGRYEGVADATVADPDVAKFATQTDAFVAGKDVAIDEMLAALHTEPGAGYAALRARAIDRLASEANAVEAAAVARQKLFGLLALGVLTLALVVTWVSSRSITRPLASLRAQAEDMAGSRLPRAVRQILDTPAGEDVVIPDVTPIEVSSRDEVAEVAAALSAVQTSAIDLAVEQAVLRRNISDSYINLGRRNQNLLSRQLDFITQLERNESDPDTLEGLFRLDHLATRMRSNAESLLVLAGIEPPRQWSAPVKLTDVVRAALGEVEDYQRVVIRHLEPAALTGAVAADIAHLSAELIENALSFSPAEQQVEIKGRLTTSGYTLAISDNGYGMTAEEIARANRRLAGAESFTVAPSRYLGHYVAGHLATRMRVVVELQDSPAGGITARIDIPMGLLANDETDPRLASLAVVSHDEPVEPVEPVDAVELDAAPSAPAAIAVPEPTVDTDPAPVAAAEAVAPAETGFTAGGLARRGARTPDEPGGPEADAVEDNHVATPADAVGPVTPGVGFGGLAIAPTPGPSLFTVVAQKAKQGGAAPASDRTATGLTRRVPGAQRPDVDSDSPPRHLAPPGAPASTSRSSAEDVYSFLSSFQAGVERGRSGTTNHTDDTGDDR